MSEVAGLAAIAFLRALVFGITGFGAALVTIPLATHLVPLPFALALFALSDPRDGAALARCRAMGMSFVLPPNVPATQRRDPRHEMVTHLRRGTAAGHVRCSGLVRPPT